MQVACQAYTPEGPTISPAVADLNADGRADLAGSYCVAARQLLL